MECVAAMTGGGVAAGTHKNQFVVSIIAGRAGGRYREGACRDVPE